MKKKLSNREFKRLIQLAECERNADVLYITATDETPRFYFYYNFRTDEITEQGIEITHSQRTLLCNLVDQFVEENEIDLKEEEREYPPINYYDEFGLDPAMFF